MPKPNLLNNNSTETLYLSISGFIIEVRFKREGDMTLYEEQFIQRVKDYYHNFLINESTHIDFVIEIVHLRVFKVLYQNEKKDVYLNFYQVLSRHKIRTYFHLSGSQLQVIIRRITHELLVQKGGFILHGSASSKNDKAFIFLGKSGAGKSTITQLLRPEFLIVGDDSVIIHKSGKRYSFYSSSAVERNANIPKNYKQLSLGAVFFLRQRKKHAIVKITDYATIIKLLGEQLYSEKEDIEIQIKYLSVFVMQFKKFYWLDFSLEDTATLKELIKHVS